MKKRVCIVIPREGNSIRFISNDRLNPGFFAAGELKSHQRVSDVEPASSDPTKWEANLARVNGPVLGPFTSREEALNAEVDWLIEHNLPTGAP